MIVDKSAVLIVKRSGRGQSARQKRNRVAEGSTASPPAAQDIRRHLAANGLRPNSRDWNQYEYAKWILLRDYVEYLVYYDYFIRIITEYIGV